MWVTDAGCLLGTPHMAPPRGYLASSQHGGRVPREAVQENKVEVRAWYHFLFTLLVEVAQSLPRFKERGHRPGHEMLIRPPS